MTCDEAKAQFDLWEDGELGSDAVAALTAHVASCPSCAAALARHRAEAAALRGALPRYAAPPRLAANVRAMLGRERPRAAPARWWPLAAAAALLLGVGAGAGVGYTRGAVAGAATDALVTSHVR